MPTLNIDEDDDGIDDGCDSDIGGSGRWTTHQPQLVASVSRREQLPSSLPATLIASSVPIYNTQDWKQQAASKLEGKVTLEKSGAVAVERQKTSSLPIALLVAGLLLAALAMYTIFRKNKRCEQKSKKNTTE